MSEREHHRSEFLNRAGLGEAVRIPLPGDASTRRYERLVSPSGVRLMLMDQEATAESPPCDPFWTPQQRRASGWNAVARLSAGRIEAFAAVANYLRSQGMSAPEIFALDADAGLAVLEDYGDTLFARSLETGTDEQALYMAAIDVMARLHETTPPDILNGPGGDWPLQVYDRTALQGGADLFVEWMPKLLPTLTFGADAMARWTAAWASVVEDGEAGASVMAHRDYHAENLIWLPERSGVARVGLIDFQDAVKAHPAWDLHSLLQDARRDVSPEMEATALDHYFTLRPDTDRYEFLRSYAGLAALNEARILGVFARLIVRDGKPRYRALMPRMWAHLNRNLKQSGLEPVARWFADHVPQDARQ